MPKLQYSGRLPVETNDDGTVPTNERERLHTLLDDALDAYEGDEIVMRTAVIHFERESEIGDGAGLPRVNIELEASGDLDQLSTVEDALATQVVGIGFEADKATAKDDISLE